MVLIPVKPNWRSGVRDSYEFLTEIITSRDGTEQRRKMRQTARRTVDLAALLERDHQRRMFDAINRSRRTASRIPDPTAEVALATATASIGATALTVDLVPAWLVTGAAFCIEVAWGQFTEHTVVSVSGLTVNFAAALTSAVPMAAVLRPVIPVLPNEAVNFNAITTDVSTTSMSYVVQPGPAATRDPQPIDIDDGLIYPNADATSALFYGRYVLLRKPNFVRAPTLAFRSGTEFVDFGRGVVKTFSPISFSQRVFTAEYLGINRSDVNFLLDVFLRAEGRLGEIMMPTWGSDFPPLKFFGVARDSITYEGTDLHATYDGDTAHTAILLHLKNGSLVPKQVQSMSTVSGNTRLLLDTELPEGVSASDVDFTSWMFVCRFATDSLTVEWITDSVARISMSLVTLSNKPVEDLLGSNWILATGFWRDLGQWEDTAVWNDAP